VVVLLGTSIGVGYPHPCPNLAARAERLG
jgi:hypothetical protein